MSIIIIGDLLFLLIVFGFLYYHFALSIIDHDKLFLKVKEQTVFSFFTEGIVSFLLFMKVYYGLNFMYFSTASYQNRVAMKDARKMTVHNKQSSVVDIEGRKETKLSKKIAVKRQRRELNKFFIASALYYIYLIILCLSLIPVLVVSSQIDRRAD